MPSHDAHAHASGLAPLAGALGAGAPPLDLAPALLRSFSLLDRRAHALFASGRARTGGATLLLVAYDERGWLWTANAGDCKAVLSSLGAPAPLNSCHNPDDPAERDRVREAGAGMVSPDFLVGGDLNVCRSLGDFDLGPPLKFWDAARGEARGALAAAPDVRVRRLEDRDEFFVAATDGVWDYYGGEGSVITDARRALRSRPRDAQACAEAVAGEAERRQRALLHRGTHGDNATVAVLSFRELPSIPRHSASRLNLRSARQP